MLYKFTNTNKYGTLRHRIIHRPNGQDGKKFIVPIWKEVLPETTLEDINWVKPKPKKVSVEKQEFKFESKSDPGHFYNVTVKNNKVDCTCSGKWRAKDRQCRHMKDVKKQLGI